MSKRRQLPDNEIILYQNETGSVNVEVLFDNDNLWLPQRRIAELYGCTADNISLHLKNIYAEYELSEEATTEKFSVVQIEGNREVVRTVKCYSLEAVIAVGYRVSSERATQFRRWATDILHKYIQKGFAIDDDRFKYGSRFSTRYFDELLAEIREIRASERMAYQKITDIYATSVDYSKDAEETRKFYATVQNKLHFAITGQTAAEIIVARADSTKPYMGLTTWRKAPDGKILSTDISVTKNYLNAEEIEHLNRIVTLYLDFAELQAARKRPMKMSDWADRLNAFLQFSEYDILNNAGKVSHEVAQALAIQEYDKFRVRQDQKYISDFDREVKMLTDAKKLNGGKSE